MAIQHALSIQTTDLDLDKFSDYWDLPDSYDSAVDIMASNGTAPINKLLDGAKDDVSRHPSPQPTHFSVPLKTNGHNGNKVLRSATVGYIAPEFKGRAEQMKSGRFQTLK